MSAPEEFQTKEQFCTCSTGMLSKNSTPGIHLLGKVTKFKKTLINFKTDVLTAVDVAVDDAKAP